MTINQRINKISHDIATESNLNFIDINTLINNIYMLDCDLDVIENIYNKEGMCGLETYRIKLMMNMC